MSDAPPDPPSRLKDVKTRPLGKGATLYRVHDGTYNPNSFNPCQGERTRFAPIFDEDGACIPSLYAADTFIAAAYETVFHDVPVSPAGGPQPAVRFQHIRHYADALLELTRDLTLVELFNVPLRNYGVTHKQLIESNAAHYPQTAKWAKAFHDQVPQDDPERPLGG